MEARVLQYTCLRTDQVPLTLQVACTWHTTCYDKSRSTSQPEITKSASDSAPFPEP